MEERKAWEQMEGEPDWLYSFFQKFLYQDLPRRVSVISKDSKLGEHALGRHRKNWNWDERATAYDMDLGQKQTAAIEARAVTVADVRVRVIKEEIEDYNLLREAWLRALELIMQDYKLEPKEFLSILSQATNIRSSIDMIARRAVELPSAYSKKVNVDVSDTEEISPDEIQLTMNGPKFLTEGDDGGE